MQIEHVEIAVAAVIAALQDGLADMPVDVM